MQFFQDNVAIIVKEQIQADNRQHYLEGQEQIKWKIGAVSFVDCCVEETGVGKKKRKKYCIDVRTLLLMLVVVIYMLMVVFVVLVTSKLFSQQTCLAREVHLLRVFYYTWPPQTHLYRALPAALQSRLFHHRGQQQGVRNQNEQPKPWQFCSAKCFFHFLMIFLSLKPALRAKPCRRRSPYPESIGMMFAAVFTVR